MERIIFLTLCILVFGSSLSSAEILNGKVLDGTDNLGLEGVLIKIMPSGAETLSDISGNFSLETEAPVLSTSADIENPIIDLSSQGVQIQNYFGKVSIQIFNMLGQLNFSTQQLCQGRCLLISEELHENSLGNYPDQNRPSIMRIRLGEQTKILKLDPSIPSLAKTQASGVLEISKMGYETKQVAFNSGEFIQVILFASIAADPYEDYRNQCLNKINAFRATEGKPPYTRWTEKESCSDLSAQKEYQTGVAHSSFEDCGEWAQNLCPRYPSFTSVLGNCLDMMWAEGPGEPFSEHGHYINMSSLSYTKVACGFYVDPNAKVWHVQNFK